MSCHVDATEPRKFVTQYATPALPAQKCVAFISQAGRSRAVAAKHVLGNLIICTSSKWPGVEAGFLYVQMITGIFIALSDIGSIRRSVGNAKHALG